MKKFFTIIFSIILLILPLSACTEEEKEYHTVTFYTEIRAGTFAYHKKAEIQVADGDVIGNQVPDTGLISYVWYTSKTGNIEWNIYSDEVKTDMSLYGRW